MAADRALLGLKKDISRLESRLLSKMSDFMARMDARMSQADARMSQADARMDRMDERMERMESRMDARFSEVTSAINRLATESIKTNARISALRDHTDAGFQRVMGLIDGFTKELKSYGREIIWIPEALRNQRLELEDHHSGPSL